MRLVRSIILSMRMSNLIAGGIAAATLCACLSAGQSSPDQAAWLKELTAWRAQHTADIGAPDGWLSLVALDWLKPGDNSVGAAITNQVRLPGSPPKLCIFQVRFERAEAKPGDARPLRSATVPKIIIQPPIGGFPSGFLVDGKTPKGGDEILADDTKQPSKLTISTLLMTIIHRGDNAALRVKDANAPWRVSFHELNWFSPNATYRVRGKWIPYNPQHTISMPTVIGTTVKMPSPGAVEFALNGKQYRLEPVVEDPSLKQLFFVMRDLSSGDESYPAGRFLYTRYPDRGLDQPGELWLDFNQLENPPCAYTKFATCPLPAPQNRLQVAIAAGEKRYGD
jgi:uncharacterized protein